MIVTSLTMFSRSTLQNVWAQFTLQGMRWMHRPRAVGGLRALGRPPPRYPRRVATPIE